MGIKARHLSLFPGLALSDHKSPDCLLTKLPPFQATRPLALALCFWPELWLQQVGAVGARVRGYACMCFCVRAQPPRSACTYVVRGQVRVQIINPCEKNTTGWNVNTRHCVLREDAQEDTLLMGLTPGEWSGLSTRASGPSLRFHSRVRAGRTSRVGRELPPDSIRRVKPIRSVAPG